MVHFLCLLQLTIEYFNTTTSSIADSGQSVRRTSYINTETRKCIVQNHTSHPIGSIGPIRIDAGDAECDGDAAMSPARSRVMSPADQVPLEFQRPRGA